MNNELLSSDLVGEVNAGILSNEKKLSLSPGLSNDSLLLSEGLTPTQSSVSSSSGIIPVSSTPEATKKLAKTTETSSPTVLKEKVLTIVTPLALSTGVSSPPASISSLSKAVNEKSRKIDDFIANILRKNAVSTTPGASSIPDAVILGEIIGATNICCDVFNIDSASSNSFVVVKDVKGKTLHKTTRSKKKNDSNPIWTVKDNCFFLLRFSVQDLWDSNALIKIELRNDGQILKTPFVIGTTEVNVAKHLDETRVTKKCYTKNELCIESITISFRFRVATMSDLRFMDQLKKKYGVCSSTKVKLNEKEINDVHSLNNFSMKVNFITEKRQDKVAYKHFMELFKNGFYTSQKDATGNIKLRVKPGPDPKRKSDTEFLTHQDLRLETIKPSMNWIEAGTSNNSLGRVFVEIIECDDLPNMDAGTSFGNKTDTFICLVHEDGYGETDVIFDNLSPMWPCWSQRAFVFNIHNSLSPLYLSAMDLDLGPSGHEYIGRVAINLNQFHSKVVYTLSYSLFPTSNKTERKSLGTITIRLYKEIYDEKKLLMKSRVKTPSIHISTKSSHTLPAINYACYGKYKEEKFDISFLESYISEILEAYEMLNFSFSSAIKSLTMWQGQVQIGSVNLPCHSAFAFFISLFIVNNPHLFPGLFFIILAWIMLAYMIKRTQHPSPWYRAKGFYHYLSILKNGTPPPPFNRIDEREGFTELEQLIINKKNRLAVSREYKKTAYALQLELDEIQKNGIIHTKEHNTDPLNRILKNYVPFLFYIQLKLRGICNLIRKIKAVATWEESQISFWIMLFFLLTGVTLVILPSIWIFRCCCKILIHLYLGPWMRLYNELFGDVNYNPLVLINEEEKKVFLNSITDSIKNKFKKRSIFVREQVEDATKTRAMRILRFGKFIAEVPTQNVTRHYDYPLPKSTALRVNLARNFSFPPHNFNNRKIIPSQTLIGSMIPELEDQQVWSNERKTQIIEKDFNDCIRKDELNSDFSVAENNKLHHDIFTQTYEGQECECIYTSSNKLSSQPVGEMSSMQEGAILECELNTPISDGITQNNHSTAPILDRLMYTPISRVYDCKDMKEEGFEVIAQKCNSKDERTYEYDTDHDQE